MIKPPITDSRANTARNISLQNIRRTANDHEI